MVVCKKCGIDKPLDDYYTVAQKRKGKWYRFRRGACKKCLHAYNVPRIRMWRAKKRLLAKQQNG